MKSRHNHCNMFVKCLLCFAIVIPLKGVSQKQVQVVTKNIERVLNYNADESLVIIAEKASVKISQWDKKTIEVKLKLISKHPNLDIAKQELNYLEYDILKEGNGYIIKNYFNATDKVRKVKGNLLAAYAIKVPKGCNLDITNLYGSLSLVSLNSDFKGRFKFVEVELLDHRGKGDIESFFGEIIAKNYSGLFKAKLEKSDMRLVAFDGTLDVQSNYGAIEVDGGDHDRMNIDGNRTKVTFSTAVIESYNYSFESTLGEIDLPSSVSIESSDQQGVISFRKDYKSDNDLVKISTTYSPIILKQTNSTNNN